MEKNKRAFTLAEVLIVLAIIGVVAAMTIPTLLNNYDKTAYITALKKFYSNTNQVLSLMAADNGCPGDIACTGLFSNHSDGGKYFGDTFAKYFKVSQNCGLSNTGDPGPINCWADSINKAYDGSNSSFNKNDDDFYYKFTTIDGMSVGVTVVEDFAFDCKTSYSKKGNGPMSKICGYLDVDINGRKGPNREGRDVFFFYITNGNGPQLYPIGGPDDDWNGEWVESGWCNSDTPKGYYCAGRILEENWQMTY